MLDAWYGFLIGFNLAALIYGRMLDRSYDRTAWYRKTLAWYREQLRFWRDLRSRD